MATARQNLEVAVELGVEVGDLLGATAALHGLARMGRARQVVDQLGELTPQVDGELAKARLTYALGAANRDSVGLEEAARCSRRSARICTRPRPSASRRCTCGARA